ncbi:MAG: tRNA pseudouridine(55) synthase TruB [Pseudomonadota bacterium]|nr:tRNA pseudouridine(55) synthase TruB [Pseudomonadota bacterium]
MSYDGFLVVDKPPGVTSHDVVAVVRAVTGLKKVGHTGTLDPFATGVLPLALGSATRLIQYLDEDQKIYDAVVRLGVLTDTGDPTGQVIEEKPVPSFSQKDLLEALATFLGPRMQTPPRYSAVKVAGRPLYDYARKGQTVEVKARPVRIDAMELKDFEGPRVHVLIRCSRGTYARVLAEEIAVALGTVGHLEELRRLGSGPFLIDQAVSFSRISEIVAGDPNWDRVLRPSRGEERVPWRTRDEVFDGLAPWVTTPREGLRHLPALTLSPIEARRFQQTGAVPPPPPGCVGPYVLLSGDEILGVGTSGSATAVPLDTPKARDRGHGGDQRARRR